MKLKISILILMALCLGAVAAPKGPKTVVVNTVKSGKSVMGFAGTTPVEITVTDGKVEKVVALPNSETPAYFQKVLDSPIFTQLIGKTVQEAAEVKLDAVSGATFSSKAVIENINIGLKEAAKKVK